MRRVIATCLAGLLAALVAVAPAALAQTYPTK